MYYYPCENCIVRATCKEKCEKAQLFEEIFIAIFMFAGCALLITIFIILSILSLNYFDKFWTWTVIIISLVVSYGSAWFSIGKDKGFSELKWWELSILLPLAPWIWVSVHVCEFYEDKIDMYYFRFNYDIAPAHIREMVNEKKVGENIC